MIARREGAFRRFHGGTLAPVRALQGTNIPRRDLSGTRPVLGAGGGRLGGRLGNVRVDVRGKSGGCGHRNRTRARVNARARGSLMVAYCVHPCRSRRRVGLDGPAPTDICGCRRNEGKRRERILGSRTASAASSAAGVALPSRTFHRQPARVTPDLDLRATPRSRPAAARVVRSRYEGARARKPRSHHFGQSSVRISRHFRLFRAQACRASRRRRRRGEKSRRVSR